MRSLNYLPIIFWLCVASAPLQGLVLGQSKDPPVVAERSTLKPEQFADGQTVFEWLTGQTWTNRSPDQKRPFGMCLVGECDHEYRFRETGEYEHLRHFIGNDQLVSEKASWNLQPGPNNSWVICRDDGSRVLAQDFRMYSLKKVEVPTGTTLKQLPELKLSAGVQQMNSVLTSREWFRGNDLNLNYCPVSIRFLPNFTYEAVHADGRKLPIGIWFATEEAIEMHGKSDEASNEKETQNDQFHRIKIIDKDLLVVDDTPYVAQDKLSKRGKIWQVFGRNEIHVSVEYDMPIRRNRPCKFDVQVSVNSLSSPVKLQRFSISKEFDHNYRGPDNSLNRTEEIAALDLKDSEIAVGEKKSFTFTAEFPESGESYFYLNTMVLGNQSWDVRHAFYFRILDSQ